MHACQVGLLLEESQTQLGFATDLEKKCINNIIYELLNSGGRHRENQKKREEMRKCYNSVIFERGGNSNHALYPNCLQNYATKGKELVKSLPN